MCTPAVWNTSVSVYYSCCGSICCRFNDNSSFPSPLKPFQTADPTARRYKALAQQIGSYHLDININSLVSCLPTINPTPIPDRATHPMQAQGTDPGGWVCCFNTFQTTKPRFAPVILLHPTVQVQGAGAADWLLSPRHQHRQPGELCGGPLHIHHQQDTSIQGGWRDASRKPGAAEHSGENTLL